MFTFSNQIFTEETFGLKGSYDVRVHLEGSDQVSISNGISDALSILIVNISGSSSTLDNLSANKLFKDPQKYVSEYRLENDEKGVLQGNFSFNGGLIREALIENNLPLWIGKSSTILVYLPCLSEENSSSRQDKISDESCRKAKQEIKNVSSIRLFDVAFPSMDLVDLNLLDILNPLSNDAFIKRIARRYNLRHWLMCFNRDDFGILLDKSYCISSVSKGADKLEVATNKLINFINSRTQLLINNQTEATIQIKIRNIKDQETLIEVLNNLDKNILVKNLNLLSIENDDINLSVHILGTKLDFKSIMIASREFEYSPSGEDKENLNFIFKKRS